MKRGWIAALLLALTACGGGSDSDSGDGEPAMDAANGLKADLSTITKVVEITEDNDPNDSIGRPGQYEAAVSIYDSRATCDSELDVTCGAKLEQWPSKAEAEKRADYIETLASGMPMLAEYHYIDGGLLLRVTGQLKPSEADEYETAFSD